MLFPGKSQILVPKASFGLTNACIQTHKTSNFTKPFCVIQRKATTELWMPHQHFDRTAASQVYIRRVKRRVWSHLDITSSVVTMGINNVRFILLQAQKVQRCMTMLLIQALFGDITTGEHSILINSRFKKNLIRQIVYPLFQRILLQHFYQCVHNILLIYFVSFCKTTLLLLVRKCFLKVTIKTWKFKTVFNTGKR